MIREEQRCKLNLLLETSFIANKVQFPEWPQLPPTTNLAAGLNTYPLVFGNHTVNINPNWNKMNNHYRSRLSGDEIKEMKQPMRDILETLHQYLTLTT